MMKAVKKKKGKKSNLVSVGVQKEGRFSSDWVLQTFPETGGKLPAIEQLPQGNCAECHHWASCELWSWWFVEISESFHSKAPILTWDRRVPFVPTFEPLSAYIWAIQTQVFQAQLVRKWILLTSPQVSSFVCERTPSFSTKNLRSSLLFSPYTVNHHFSFDHIS